MEKIISYENLRNFAYSNDKLIKGKIKGIVLFFYGLNCVNIHSEDPEEALFYAEKDIIYLVPYYNPWCWMNEQAVEYVDELIDVLRERYSLDENVKIVSTGGSMGGLSSIVYCAYAKITPVSCVANCPVCDLVYHFSERPDLPRTLYSAFYNFEGNMETALESRSPLHLAEKMPKISYTIYHCEQDMAVNLEKHSLRLFEKMKSTHDVKLITVPDRGHCNLPPDVRAKYNQDVLDAFN